MAVDKSLVYGTTTAITITLNGLATSATAGRKSTSFDFAGAPMAVIDVVCEVGAGTIANDKGAHVWLARSLDGTNYEDGATSGDADYTPPTPSNMLYLGMVSIPVQSATYRKSFVVLDPYPGQILVVRNYSGIALGAGSSAQYRSVTEHFV